MLICSVGELNFDELSKIKDEREYIDAVSELDDRRCARYYIATN